MDIGTNIDIYGNFILWKGGSNVLKLYDLNEGKTYEIKSEEDHDFLELRFSGDTVVWREYGGATNQRIMRAKLPIDTNNGIIKQQVIKLDREFKYPGLTARSGESTQIRDQWCDAFNPCPNDLKCFSFPNTGPRCVQPDPCSYFECPEGTQCVIAESYPGRVMCQCISPGCLTMSGDKDIVKLDEEPLTDISIKRYDFVNRKKPTTGREGAEELAKQDLSGKERDGAKEIGVFSKVVEFIRTIFLTPKQ